MTLLESKDETFGPFNLSPQLVLKYYMWILAGERFPFFYRKCQLKKPYVCGSLFVHVCVVVCACVGLWKIAFLWVCTNLYVCVGVWGWGVGVR